MSWTWRWFDYAIVIVAVIAGFAVWFIPSFESSPEIRKLYAQQRELKERRLQYAAQQAEIKKEREELGLVYIGPPDDAAKPAASAKKPN